MVCCCHQGDFYGAQDYHSYDLAAISRFIIVCLPDIGENTGFSPEPEIYGCNHKICI